MHGQHNIKGPSRLPAPSTPLMLPISLPRTLVTNTKRKDIRNENLVKGCLVSLGNSSQVGVTYYAAWITVCRLELPTTQTSVQNICFHSFSDPSLQQKKIMRRCRVSTKLFQGFAILPILDDCDRTDVYACCLVPLQNITFVASHPRGIDKRVQISPIQRVVGVLSV
jgi:hypothetical protein